jgi:asparagine synthase (glutamine-hydrolysing)
VLLLSFGCVTHLYCNNSIEQGFGIWSLEFDLYPMCGIAGIISPAPAKLQDVNTMISCLSHRGPDGDAVWHNDNATAILGHRRLAIIDLSEAAAQPMHYLERYTIVHNGEIYNYKEIRESLSAKGHSFKTQSDTEVVLAAYHEWKNECLQHFDGMFAFAIWDEQEQKLFAARDRFGEKPFYYSSVEEGLIFASEIKAFKKTGVAKEYNGDLLLQYIANGFVQDAMDAGATFYHNIKKLPARHYLEFYPREGSLKITPYFDIDKSTITISPGDATQQFKELFFSSVQKRLRSDVEIGTSLSGGIDSSSVVAAIHQLKAPNAPQQAFTASFPSFEKDETGFASLIARQYGLRHHLISPSSTEMMDDLEKFLSQHDEPVSSASVYAQYKVYQSAKQHGVKVILDGQGADEVLAGYSKYLHWFLQELYSGDMESFKKESATFNYPFNWKNKLAASFPSWAAIQLEQKAVKNQRRSLFNKDFIAAQLNKNSIHKPVVGTLNDILYFDVFGGPLEELLRNADRNAMAHGVEVRLPFLNDELVQFIFSLPSILKMHNGFTKYILRQAMDDMLPKEITWRKDKIGFEPPQEQWMKNPLLQEKIQEAKKKLVQERILNSAVVRQPIKPKAAHEGDNYDWRFLSAAQMV